MLADLPEDYDFTYSVLPELKYRFLKTRDELDWPLPEHLGLGLYSDAMGNFEHYACDILEDPFNLFNFSKIPEERIAELMRRSSLGLPLENYGICDTVEQVIEKWPFLVTSQDKYLLNFVEVKKTLGGEGGWRWHKNGEYIGAKNPQCEYLDDEPEIDSVLMFDIYRFIDKD